MNATLAEREWPGESALGKHLILTHTKLEYTVIGVVGDVRHSTLTEEPLAQIYGAHEQLPRIFTGAVVRTSGPPSPMVSVVRQAVWSVDKDQPMWKFASMTDLLAGDRRPAQALALLMVLVAAVAVLLSGVGIYGVMSSSVARRTREIGIRMALGAPAARVIREVVLRALALSGIAFVLGLGGAWALRKVLAGLLFGVGPFDPVVLASAAAVLFVVSLAAAYLPARRAARVDPTIALASDA